MRTFPNEDLFIDFDEMQQRLEGFKVYKLHTLDNEKLDIDTKLPVLIQKALNVYKCRSVVHFYNLSAEAKAKELSKYGRNRKS